MSKLSVILGPAGSGKSTLLRERSGGDPNYAKVSATTGIAAVNLGPGVTTMHSALRFYNEESAREALEYGRLTTEFCKIAEQGYHNFVIDEISMMTDKMLEIIVEGLERAEIRLMRSGAAEPCGLILVGDMLQLPPVKGRFCFESPVWQKFENNITQLTTIYRQSDPAFLEALNCARAGHGVSTIMALKKAGVEFVSERNDFFEGTTLVPTNDMANKINGTRFDAITGELFSYLAARWGQESGEWRDIPEVLTLKESAYVMVLANEPRSFRYVNGDQGFIVSGNEQSVNVHIKRSDGSEYDVEIPYVMRVQTQKDKPVGVADFSGFLIDGFVFKGPGDILKEQEKQLAALNRSDAEKQVMTDDEVDSEAEFRQRLDKQVRVWYAKFFDAYDSYVNEAVERRVPYWSDDKQRWVVGWIQYLPIRLAYASTTHKAQGLTLDSVQIDARNRFAGSPAMQYVALSRCRTAGGIRVVCSPADYARRVQTAKECLRWV